MARDLRPSRRSPTRRSAFAPRGYVSVQQVDDAQTAERKAELTYTQAALQAAAKRLVILLGQRESVGVAVRGGDVRPRWTKPREWLETARRSG